MTTDIETKFVVLTTNRSGSTWLMSMLNSLPNVTAQGELFLRRARAVEKRWDSEFALPRFVETKPAGLALRPFSVFSYLDDLYGASGAVGFKLMYAQLGFYPEILVYLIRYRIRVVHLIRQNHLDVMLSYAVKAKIGQAHVLVGQSTPDDIHVELDTRNLVGQLARLQRKQKLARGLLKWCGLPHLEIVYEDLLRDPHHFRTICDFLSLESEQALPHSTILKSRRGDQREVLRNYDEVKQALANSEFTMYLE